MLTERALWQTATAQESHALKERTMSPTKRYAKKQAKARQRRRAVQERLALHMGVAKAPVCNRPLIYTPGPCAVPIIPLSGTTH